MLIFVQLIQTSFLSCDEPRPFYQNPPLTYLPFSLVSSVLVLISPVRQEEARYVAQREFHCTDSARLLLSRTLCEYCAVQPNGGGVGMPHIPEADGAQRVNYGLEANSFKTRLCGNQKHNGWQCFLYLKQDTINNNRLVLKTL